MAEPIKIKKIQTNEGNYHDIDAKCWDGYFTSDLVTIDGRSILSGEDISTMININYNDLVELRNSGKLIAGQKYRIIDYETTTSKKNTESAGHMFDIIVEALSETELSEIAHAFWNVDDGYFDSENLNAWQLWYTIDNDKNRFDWASSKSFIDSSDCTISVGYTMDSEEGLYKFDERIKFISNMWNDPNAEPYLEGSAIDELVTHWGYETEPNGLESLTLYGLNLEFDEETGKITSEDGVSSDRWYYRGIITVDGEDYDYWQKVDDERDYYLIDERQLFFLTNRIVSGSTAVVVEEGKGVIYRMIDEYGNDCPYDFKNIKFYNETHDKYVYTFSWIESDGTVIDTSIFGNKTLKDDVGDIIGVYGNIIRPYYCGTHSLQQRLNNIVFISDREYDGGLYYGCYSNTFGYNCYNNTFGNDCENNIFDNDCHNNTFGNNFYNNTFGYYCSANTFGNYCYNNTFGNNCDNNIFGNNCDNNTFGNNCNNNTLDDNCNKNIFDDECDDNTFGNNCDNNTFGNGCHNNTFGNRCYSNILRGSACDNNTLGDYCSTNTFGYDCNNNTFGNNCNNNTFDDYCAVNTFGNGCRNNTFGEYCGINTFGYGCRNNTFTIHCSTNTFGDYCSINTFGNDCEINTFGNNCDNNTFGNNCYNNTFGNSCKYNSFRIDASIDSDLLNYCKNIHISDGCSYNVIYHREQQTSFDTRPQNINIIRGVFGTSDAYNFIPINKLGVEYEIKVAKNTAGEIKIYCEADLIA